MAHHSQSDNRSVPPGDSPRKQNVESTVSFNPYGLHSVHTALGLLTYPKVSPGAKLLYGRLALYLGQPNRKDGRVPFCNPSVSEMAKAMGTPLGTTENWLAELIEQGFIQRVRRRRGPADCVFLPHPCLVNGFEQGFEQGFDSAELRNQDPAPVPDQEPPNMADQECQDPANPESRSGKSAGLDPANQPICYKERARVLKHSVKTFKEKTSSSALEATRPVAETPEPADDDSSLFNETEKNLTAAVGRCFASGSVPMPRAKFPSCEVLGMLSDAGVRVDDLAGFFESYFKHMKNPPSTWGHTTTSLRNWLGGDEVKSNIQIRQMQQEQNALEQERKAERERLMTTQTDPAAARKVLWEHVSVEPDSVRALICHLQATGVTAISPRELNQQVKAWQPCAECHDRGYRGSALWKDLAFCGCQAGADLRVLKGNDWPEKEIERVGRDLKSRMTEAAVMLGWAFATDAIPAAEVSEFPDRVEIAIRREHQICLDSQGAKGILEYLGDSRKAVVSCPEWDARICRKCGNAGHYRTHAGPCWCDGLNCPAVRELKHRDPGFIRRMAEQEQAVSRMAILRRPVQSEQAAAEAVGMVQ